MFRKFFLTVALAAVLFVPQSFSADRVYVVSETVSSATPIAIVDLTSGASRFDVSQLVLNVSATTSGELSFGPIVAQGTASGTAECKMTIPFSTGVTNIDIVFEKPLLGSDDDVVVISEDTDRYAGVGAGSLYTIENSAGATITPATGDWVVWQIISDDSGLATFDLNMMLLGEDQLTFSRVNY